MSDHDPQDVPPPPPSPPDHDPSSPPPPPPGYDTPSTPQPEPFGQPPHQVPQPPPSVPQPPPHQQPAQQPPPRQPLQQPDPYGRPPDQVPPQPDPYGRRSQNPPPPPGSDPGLQPPAPASAGGGFDGYGGYGGSPTPPPYQPSGAAPPPNYAGPPPSYPNPDTGTNWKKIGIILGAIFAGFVLLVGGCVFLVFNAVRGPLDATNDMMASVVDGDFAEAATYTSSNSACFGPTAEADLASVFTQSPVTDYNFLNSAIESSNGVSSAVVSGSLSFSDGGQRPATVTLTQEGEDWKVCGLEWQ